MPFIVTTKRPLMDPPLRSDGFEVASRRAVATLEEARDAIRKFMEDRFTYGRRYFPDADALIDSGGTVGPLPDGTVIEVKPSTWLQLAIAAGMRAAGLAAAYAERRPSGINARRIIVEFDAREARS